MDKVQKPSDSEDLLKRLKCFGAPGCLFPEARVTHEAAGSYGTLARGRYEQQLTSPLPCVNRRVLESELRVIGRRHGRELHSGLLLSRRQLDQQTIRIKLQPSRSILPPSRLMVRVATVGTPLIVLSTREDACPLCHEAVRVPFISRLCIMSVVALHSRGGGGRGHGQVMVVLY
jgi:hypothetical protein